MSESFDHHSDFVATAERRFANIVARGKVVGWPEMRRYLLDRVAGRPAKKPRLQKLPRHILREL
jgi:hypothetical protein